MLMRMLVKAVCDWLTGGASFYAGMQVRLGESAAMGSAGLPLACPLAENACRFAASNSVKLS